MLGESDFNNIYYKYIQLEIVLSEKLVEWMKKNPDNTEDYEKRSEHLRTIEFLRNKFHQLYHVHLMQGLTHGEFISERKRMLDLHLTEKYYLNKRIAELEKENKTLKENVSLL